MPSLRPQPIQPAESTRSVLETVIGSALASLLWAILLNATLELFQSGGDLTRLVGYNLQIQPDLFFLNAAVVWLVVLLVLAVTGRLWTTFAITLAAALVIGVVDHQKLQLRREPVYPSDVDFLRTPGFLVEMAGARNLVIGAVVLVALVVGLLLFGRRAARAFRPVRRRATPRAWAALVVVRLAVVALCLAGVNQVIHFNAPGNRVQKVYLSTGLHWAWWSQQVNYQRHGVVAGLLYNLDVPAMEVPGGYSEATMDALADKYAARAESVNAKRDAKALDGVNVVVVLSEAFSDPTAVKGATVEGDPIPYTRRLMKQTTSGSMYAQLVGGGTANMEYEVLTGLSLADYQPQLNTPYQQLVPKYSTFPSIVGYFKNLGYAALAIHPYLPEFYHRNEVYPIFGFDRFITDHDMSVRKKEPKGSFISDESAFDETLGQLEQSSKPVFLNLVTMQNHYPWDDQFDRRWPVSGVSGNTKAQLGGYATGINYTDKALQRFLADLTASDEKTVVVFYGDHLPVFWPDSIYEQNGDTAMRTTPFFIWSNFPTKKMSTPALTSPIHFLPMVMDQLGAPEPPLYTLLDEIRREVPAMEQNVMFDHTGERVESADLSPRAVELLSDYRMVLYDLSVGKRYSQDRMFYPPDGGSAAAAGQ